MIPLANCSIADRLRDQFLKSRGPRLRKWFLHEPIPNAHNVDGCCRQDRLERRFRPSAIPSVPEPIRPDPLRQRALNTGASGVLGRLRCGGFSCTCGLPCHVVLLPTHGDRPSFRARAVDPCTPQKFHPHSSGHHVLQLRQWARTSIESLEECSGYETIHTPAPPPH
jgi:hypothetical protein